jgi:hypothetical protein
MTGKEQASRPSRRSFLRGASLGIGTVTAVSVMGANQPAEATRPQTGHRKAGYRETPHVRRVYELSRF